MGRSTHEAITTHDVVNQATPLDDYDVFGADRALADAAARHLDDTALKRLHGVGIRAGSAQARRDGELANTNPPVLRTHDRYGHRIDEVEYHPAWHSLLGAAVGYGLAGGPWRAERAEAGAPADGGAEGGADGCRTHVERAAAFVVWTQTEAGHLCPVSMTHAAVPALRREPEVAAEWVPRLISGRYDPGLRVPQAKAGCLAGMGMTEKQGGSDVRANTTRAQPLAAAGEYALTGHKWFCSAPMNDVFLVLAQAPEGLSCFLVPRVLPDGSRNVFRLQRLKDKLGNRSNASSEVEFDGTWARRVGEPGRGVRTIIDMVAATRLDCVSGSTGLIRQAVVQAVHHARHRATFGRRLVDAPLMRNVLADLALEAEAATVTAVRLAAAFDAVDAAGNGPGQAPSPGGEDGAGEDGVRRLGLAVGKYWVTRRAIAVAAEAMECLGGNGYVEESGMPRLYREAPVNSIWEGSGNVNALDVLRVLSHEPTAAEAFLADVASTAGADTRLDAAVGALADDLARIRSGTEDPEWGARLLVERLATAWQASLLVRYAPQPVAEAYLAARIAGAGGPVFGTLPSGVDAEALLDRAGVPEPGF